MTVTEYKARRDKRKKITERAIAYNRENQSTEQDARYLNGWRWIENPEAGYAHAGLRFVGKAHDVRGSGNGNLPYFDRSLTNHTGWFIDNFQDATVCGLVYQLPARPKYELKLRRGKLTNVRTGSESVYVPGVSDAYGNDGALLDFHSATSDLKDAVRASDRMAEIYAEHEREYQAKESAECRIADIADEIKTLRESRRSLLRELRANCAKFSGLTEVRSALRARVAEFKAECRELAKERDKLRDDFWSVVPNGY